MNYAKLFLLLILCGFQPVEAMLTQGLARGGAQGLQLLRGTGAAREAFPGLMRTMEQPISRLSQQSMVQRFMHTPMQSPTTLLGRTPSWAGSQATPAVHGFWRSIGDRFRGLMQSNNAGIAARNIAGPKGESSSGWSARAAAIAAVAGYGAAKSLMPHDRASANEEMESEETAAVDKIGSDIWDNLRNATTVQGIIDTIPAGLEGSVAVKIAGFLLGYINTSPSALSYLMWMFPGTVDALTKFLVTYPQDLANRVPEVAKLVGYLLDNGSANAKLMLKEAIDDNQEIIADTNYGKQVLSISGIVPQLRVSLSEAVDAVTDFATATGSRLQE